MTTEALPVAEQPAEASEVNPADILQPQTEAPETEAKEEKPEEKKPEKTPEQREIERQRRKIDRLVKQREELRAQVTGGLREKPIESDNRQQEPDSEPLTLSRKELQELVKAEAEKLAPTLKQQQDEIEHRRSVLQTLSKEWGTEKFEALASDLDDAFGGLADRSGKPKPATDAIFESEDPKSLIEYLADPENATEAEAFARMSAVQAGRALAKLESKLAAKKAEAKPQPSKAATPIEPVRSGGNTSGPPDPRDTKAWIKWANEQERKGLL